MQQLSRDGQDNAFRAARFNPLCKLESVRRLHKRFRRTSVLLSAPKFPSKVELSARTCVAVKVGRTSPDSIPPRVLLFPAQAKNSEAWLSLRRKLEKRFSDLFSRKWSQFLPTVHRQNKYRSGQTAVHKPRVRQDGTSHPKFSS